jgi:hypothetical protein
MINNYLEYFYNWGVKINDDKCYYVEFGYYNDRNVKVYIKNKEILKKSELEYLGYKFKYNLDDNLSSYNNFNSVRSSFFALSTFGLNPYGFNPFLQSYIYKCFCISKFLYCIEIITLNKTTIAKVNVNQNIFYINRC